MAGSKAGRLGVSTPLTVITLFVSLAEAAMAFAATQTTGNIQAAFTFFSIAFPCGVAAAFFYVLWHRNYVFYSPGEFGQQNVGDFVGAMQRQQPQSQESTLVSVTARFSTQAPTTQVPADEERAADVLIGTAEEPYWNFLQGEVDRFFETQGLRSPAQVLRVMRKFHVAAIANAEFERINGSIFGSQIAILQHLTQNGPATLEALRPFYEAARNDDPALFEKYLFESYIHFMQSSALIQDRAQEVAPALVEITLKGDAFLRFRAATGKPPRAL